MEQRVKWPAWAHWYLLRNPKSPSRQIMFLAANLFCMQIQKWACSLHWVSSAHLTIYSIAFVCKKPLAIMLLASLLEYQQPPWFLSVAISRKKLGNLRCSWWIRQPRIESVSSSSSCGQVQPLYATAYRHSVKKMEKSLLPFWKH